jgi:hypothetical protein
VLAFGDPDRAGVPDAAGFLFLAHTASIRTGGWVVKVLSFHPKTDSNA